MTAYIKSDLKIKKNNNKKKFFYNTYTLDIISYLYPMIS